MADSSGVRLDTLYWELEVRVARAQAEKEALAAGQGVGTALDKGVAQSDTSKGAAAWVESLSNDLRARREDIKREAVAGLITPAEAGAAGRAASAQYVKELRGGLSDLRGAGTIGNADLPALLGRGADALRLQRTEAELLAGALNKTSVAHDAVGKASEHAVPGLGRITLAFESIIEKATEANPVVGKIGASLLEMGVGGLVTGAVIGGIALIVVAFNKLTEGSRKLKEETEKAISSLERLQRIAPAAQLSADIAKTKAEIEGQREALKTLTAAADFSNPAGDPSVLPGTLKARAEEIKRLQGLIKTGEAELNELTQKGAAATVRGFTDNLASLIKGNKANADQIANARALLAAWNADFDKLGKNDVEGRAALLSQIKTLEGAFDSIDKAKARAEKADATPAKAGDRAAEARQRARQAFDSAIAARTPEKADDLEEQIKRLTKAATDAKVPVGEIAQKVRDLRAAFAAQNAVSAEKFAKELRDLTAQSTVTAVDDLNNALTDLQKSMREGGATQAQIDQVTAIKQSMVDATAAAEKLAPILEKIKGDTAAGFNLTGNLNALNKDGGLIDQAIAARNAAKPGSTAQASAQSNLDKLLAEELELRKKIKALQDGSAEKTKGLAADTAKLSGEIANAANAAFGLASAFLGVNSNITKALGSIGQLAGGINNVSSLADTAGSFSKLLSTGSGIASALPGIGQAIGGALALGATLFGKSPDEQARIQRQKENTAALQDLSKHIGDLGKNITGTDVSKVTGALSDQSITAAVDARQKYLDLSKKVNQLPNAGVLSKLDADVTKAINDVLTAAGLSAHQFAEIAKELGITVDEAKLTAKDIETVRAALKKSELGQFADTFTGQIAKMEAEARLFDIKDPIAQLKAFRAALESIGGGGNGGILAETIDAFNTSTPEGIAAAIKQLQDLFTAITSGKIDPSRFGGLTGQQLIDAIEKTKDLLSSGAQAGTGGFNVSTQITEVTGSRMSALLSTANIFAEQTSLNTAAIVKLLGGGLGGMTLVSPPPVLNSASGSGGNGPITFTVNVTVNGGVGDTQAIGQKIGDATIRAIDSGLGSRAKWAQRAVGNVVRA